MKSFYLLLSAFLSFWSFNVMAHSVQVQYCVSCNGDLRIWVEHWHGAEDPSSTTMTIDLTVNGNTTTQTSVPGGSVQNMQSGNLPGCSTPITYATGCPGEQNTYNDWVYYDFTGLPQNQAITFTLISGNTVFTQDGCNMYPLSVTFTLDNLQNLPNIMLCEGTDPGPVQLGGGASWTNSNSAIGLPASGNGAVQNFTPIGPAGTTATINYTTNCGSGSYDYIILPPPTTEFSITSNGTSTSSICLGNTFDFIDNSTIPAPDSITGWLWDFGDGNTSNLQNPSHTFATAGTYDVQLTTSSDLGCNAASLVQQIIINDTPNPIFSANPTCANSSMSFVDLSSVNGGAISNWQWDILNDNSTEYTSQNPSHTFTSGGTYPVQLTIESADGCIDSITQNVIVNYLPQVSFISDSVCLGNMTSFTDQSSVTNGIVTFWDWDFGFGISGISNNPTTLFSAIGNQNVNLTITTNQGCSASATGSAFVHSLPNTNFSVSDVCVYNPVSTNNTSFIENSALTYSWNFGDGSALDIAQNPDHNYANAGVYQVDLTATSNENCISTATEMVKIYDQPIADFSVDTTCAETYSQFVDQSLIPNVINGDVINNWEWDVDNNAIIDYNSQNTQHNYMVEGPHNTNLIVTTAFGCQGSGTKTAMVWPLPEVDYSYQNVCLHDSTQFTELSTISNLFTFNTIDILVWNFGDGTFCTCANPNHLFPNSTDYGTKLSATSNHGCFNETIKVITINPLPNPEFVADSICVNSPPTTYTDLSTIVNGSITSWVWNFGDGNSSTENEVSNTFDNDGYYNTTLTLTSSEGCINSITKPIRVYEAPTASLTSDITQACSPSDVEFTDLSYSATTNIQTWFWDFGDGTTTTGQNPIMTFDLEDSDLESELFDVELTVTNSFGCSSSVLVSDYLEIFSTPVASFTFNPLMPSVSDPEVEFENTSTNADDYTWDFGNGYTSQLTNPLHMYSENEPNIYNVQLIAYNNSQMCSDTAYASVQVDDVIIFYVPNAFTPDGDNYNNIWQPQFYSGYDPYDYHCMIFNRWGEVVWESFDASAGWDGNYGGKGLVQDGTYVWKIDFKESMSAKTHQHVGHVTVLQ